MLDFLKKKLRKKVVVAVAIPYTKAQFDNVFERGDSDFIKSLSTLYKTNDGCVIWERYSSTAKTVCDNLRAFEKRGAIIIPELTTDRINGIADAEIAILIAHHSDTTNAIEFADRMVTATEFVNSIPLVFHGLLDMSSCYSTTTQLSIKMRCPKCHILAVQDRTPLQLRMVVYDYVINAMSNKPEMDYLDAIKSAFSIILRSQKQNGTAVNPDIIYLGGSAQSSVFAPKEIERGQPFLIQVAIHKPEASDMVEIMAREADGSTSLRNPLRLKLKLKTNDRIDLALKIDSIGKDDFKVKRARDFFYWDNEPRFTDFTVFVSEQCLSKSCIATIKICINKIPAGDITFRSEVVDRVPQNVEAAEVVFENYDKAKEMNAAKSALLCQLESELGLLIKQSDESQIQPSPFLRDIEICKNSINLLKSSITDQQQNKVYKVFISSTSDMHEFRKIIEQRVLECSMYPEMYEKWPQKDMYPRDYCIEKVLLSDIFVCILGANYGYVEPLMDTSMTEIEFRVALMSGKPILVYVLDNYESKMSSYLPDHIYEVEKQRKLINELDKSRMVEFFNDSIGLALLSSRELTLLQKELDHERITQ